MNTKRGHWFLNFKKLFLVVVLFFGFSLTCQNVFAADVGVYTKFSNIDEVKNYYNSLQNVSAVEKEAALSSLNSISAFNSNQAQSLGHGKYEEGTNTLYQSGSNVFVFNGKGQGLVSSAAMMVMKTSDGYWAWNFKKKGDIQDLNTLSSNYNVNIQDFVRKTDLYVSNNSIAKAVEEMKQAGLSQDLIDAYLRFKENKYTNESQKTADIEKLKANPFFKTPTATSVINPETGAYQTVTPGFDLLTPNQFNEQQSINKGINQARAGNANTTDNGRCVFNEWGAVKNSEYYGGSSLWNCIEQVLYSVLGIMAWVLGLAVWLFTAVFDITVLGMTKFINSMEAINIVWKVFRDFSNILFIFILLYLAISTIIGLNEHGVKHTLSKLILVAVLINFSMFFAKVVIDSSNILAISFYKKIQPSDNTADFSNIYNTPTKEGSIDIKSLVKESGIAGAFMGSFKLQKIYEDKAGEVADGATAFASRPDAGTVFIMGTIAMFIVFCIFIAATIIFIKRLTTLTILVMTSSLAFAASLLHKTEHMAHEWWEKLLAEAFYAPVFVAVIWMAILVMTDPNFGGTFLDKKAEGFFNVSTIINYIIVINFFIMALVAGEKMGAGGASGAMKLFKGLKSNLGSRMVQAGFRKTAGAWAYKYLEGKAGGKPHAFVQWATKAMSGQVGIKIAGKEIPFTKKIAEIVATGTRGALKGAVDAKLGAGPSFREQFGERQHAIAEHVYEIKDNPQAVAKYMSELSRSGVKNLDIRVGLEKYWEDLDSKGQAEVLTALDDVIENEKDTNKKKEMRVSRGHLWDRLNPMEQASVEKNLEGPLAYHQFKFNEFVKGKSDGHGGLEGGIEAVARVEEKIKKETNPQKLAELQKELVEAKAVSQESKVKLRSFVAQLKPDQQAGLSTKQKMNAEIRRLLSAKTISNLESKLNPTEGKDIGEDTIDRAINNLKIIQDAHLDGQNPEARKKALRMVEEHKRYIGVSGAMTDEEIDKLSEDEMYEKADKALDYYDQEVTLKRHNAAMAQSARNLSRALPTKEGADGEKIRQKFDKAMSITRAKKGEKKELPKDEKK